MGKKTRKPKVTITLDNREDLKELNALAALLDTTLVNAVKYSVYFVLRLLQEQTKSPSDAPVEGGLVCGVDGQAVPGTGPLIVHPDDYEVVVDANR